MISFAFDYQSANGAFKLNLEGQLPLGKTTAVFGPSGAGKTTFLRLLAGLERPNHGHLMVGDEIWLDAKQFMSVQQRRIGMVFQDFALFSHLSVYDNVAFGAGRQDQTLVEELLTLTELSSLAQQRPTTLSGGQRQRVALARALASQPRLLLLDEPLSALEQPLRHTLRQMLRDMQTRFGFTTVLVSHDLTEVFSLADQVLQLDNGIIATMGTPAELFSPKRHQPDHYQLHATVLAVHPTDTQWQVSVQLGQQVMEIPVDEAQVGHLFPGVQVVLSAQAWRLCPAPTEAES